MAYAFFSGGGVVVILAPHTPTKYMGVERMNWNGWFGGVH